MQQKNRSKEKLIEQNNEYELEIQKKEYDLKQAEETQKVMMSRVGFIVLVNVLFLQLILF